MVLGVTWPSVSSPRCRASGGALLALGDQLADGNDGAADCATQLSEIAGAVDDLSRPSVAGRVRAAFASLGQLWPGGLR